MLWGEVVGCIVRITPYYWRTMQLASFPQHMLLQLVRWMAKGMPRSNDGADLSNKWRRNSSEQKTTKYS